MRSFLSKTFAFLMLFVLSGCATIVSGTTQKISVSTQPSGADATADGVVTVKTPGHLTLERKSNHVIVFSKESYKTTTVFVHKMLNEMAAGNILLGGIIGAGIDAASGSGNKLVPERIDLILEEGSGQADAPKFASEKDQKFYEEHIMKKKLEADKKAAEKEAEKAKQTSSQNFVAASSSSDVAPAATTGANFGPKVK